MTTTNETQGDYAKRVKNNTWAELDQLVWIINEIKKSFDKEQYIETGILCDKVHCHLSNLRWLMLPLFAAEAAANKEAIDKINGGGK